MPAIAVNYFRICKFKLFYKCTSTTNVENPTHVGNPTNVGNLAVVQSSYICGLGPGSSRTHPSTPWPANSELVFRSHGSLDSLSLLITVADGSTVKYFGPGCDGQEFNSRVRDFYFGQNNPKDPNDPINRPRTSMHFSQYSLNFGFC